MTDHTAAENRQPWRSVGRTMYLQVWSVPSSDADVFIGIMDSPELAAEVVRAHNQAIVTDQSAKEFWQEAAASYRRADYRWLRNLWRRRMPDCLRKDWRHEQFGDQ